MGLGRIKIGWGSFSKRRIKKGARVTVRFRVRVTSAREASELGLDDLLELALAE